MKSRFSTLDIIAIVPELNEKCKGLRVINVYNVNNKTYLLKLSKSVDAAKEEDENVNKNFLLLESGMRIHLTEYNWPKESNPNGFAMKVRKHVKNKRIEYIRQLGYNRTIDIQFGINEAAYHIILELYDKGNIFFTDYNFVILNLLRTRKNVGENDYKFTVMNYYPIDVDENFNTLKTLDRSEISEIIEQNKVCANLKKFLTSNLKVYSSALIDHCFTTCNLKENIDLNLDKSANVEKIHEAIQLAKEISNNVANKREGYILYKEEEDNILQNSEEEKKKIVSFLEFNPIVFIKHTNLEKKKQNLMKFESFNKAVDIFFSNIEGQKIDNQFHKRKKDAIKKLENIKLDHEKRLQNLEEKQKEEYHKGYLIQINDKIVEKALFILRSALARQMSWEDIKRMLKEAKDAGDFVASKICSLKFGINAFTMLLDDPYEQDKSSNSKPLKVDISLELSAHKNARKYFEERKHAKEKEDKTIEASNKALKNVEIKTAMALKEIHIKSSIVKSRKILWFEKFFWFISSENYIVIAGRDAQQNELIVKRHLRKNDLYVHADFHGASSVVIKNMSPDNKIPSRTIEEAGCMSVCYSNAWHAKIPAKAWWVNADQVSKVAPSGEYLTTGSFMIRGKKNYLPTTQLVMGFSFFFRLGEESIENHVNDRRVKYVESKDESTGEEFELKEVEENDQFDLFPDTKIKTVGKIEKEEETISESMKPKFKMQQKSKPNKEKKKEVKEVSDNEYKQLNKQPITKNKRSKVKNKRNKKDDWSDEEDKITIKLKKKLQKDNRLQNLENLTVALSLSDEDSIDKNSIDKDSINEDSINQDSMKIDDEKSKFNNAELDKVNEDISCDAPLSLSNDEEILLEQRQNQNISEDISENICIEHEDEEEKIEEETNDQQKKNEYLKLVNSLTGQPLNDDILLYCVPVVAPYQSLINCKYKVKVLPGISKRGQCAKTALQIFLNDRNITPREQDLIKSMRDQDIARNLPDKIKITAQSLQQVKRQIKRKKKI